MQQRKFAVKRQRITSTPHHWLKGLIRCGYCGCTFVRSNSRLRCNGSCKGACECSTTLKIEDVEKLVLERLKIESKSCVKINITKKEKKTDNEKSEIKILEKQLDLSNEKKKRIKIAFESGIDTIDEYKENKIRINNEIEELNKKIESLKNKNYNDSAIKNKIQENMNNVYNILTNADIDMKKKYDISHFLINKIVYDEENNNLTLYYNELVDTLKI